MKVELDSRGIDVACEIKLVFVNRFTDKADAVHLMDNWTQSIDQLPANRSLVDYYILALLREHFHPMGVPDATKNLEEICLAY